MLAWMNEESLRLTWSRAKPGSGVAAGASCGTRELPAATSKKFGEIYYDCDGDTLLIRVDAAGPACHTGEMSCFFTKLE